MFLDISGFMVIGHSMLWYFSHTARSKKILVISVKLIKTVTHLQTLRLRIQLITLQSLHHFPYIPVRSDISFPVINFRFQDQSQNYKDIFLTHPRNHSNWRQLFNSNSKTHQKRISYMMDSHDKRKIFSKIVKLFTEWKKNSINNNFSRKKVVFNFILFILINVHVSALMSWSLSLVHSSFISLSLPFSHFHVLIS